MQRPVGPSSSLRFSSLTHRHWRGKSRFWIKNKSFCVSHCLWHLSTSRTAAGRSKMGAVLIQLGLRLLLADVQLQEREMDKMGLSWRNRPPPNPVLATETCFTAASQIKLLPCPGRFCSELTECSWTRRGGHITDARSHTVKVDSGLVLNFGYKDVDHVIIAVSLLLFTFTLTQIGKEMRKVFIYVDI